jgi:signal transduction histidine kinase
VEALEPTLELLAIDDLEARYREQIVHATERLAKLAEQRRDLLRRSAAFLDVAASRLDHAESHGSYDAVRVVSESTAGRDIAALIRQCVDTLADSARALEHSRSREYLHDMFALHGAAVFEPRIAYHVGKQRESVLTCEWDAWRHAGQVAA